MPAAAPAAAAPPPARPAVHRPASRREAVVTAAAAAAAPTPAAAQTVRTPKAHATAPVPFRASTRRVRWFLLGIAFGAIVAMLARGEGSATLHDIREWSAGMLRSLERRPPETAPPAAGSASMPAAPIPIAARRPKDAPCPVDPGPADPCAELLLPFRPGGGAGTTAASAVASLGGSAIPVVSVESLPRAKPSPTTRRHPRVVKIAPAPTPAPASDDADDGDGDAAGDPPAPPARARKHEDIPPPEASSSPQQQQTASND
jgi:hypothetical protein